MLLFILFFLFLKVNPAVIPNCFVQSNTPDKLYDDFRHINPEGSFQKHLKSVLWHSLY
eukprot:TRINITY_DN6589_c0_g1_i1.p1 TRINITY_DN6589_c0_g1~~TRINITY_DN6589_c0_g1_i1.p1  ORF type:complete len:58 (+),score=2.85 TRINITY_DN6589_c0_g1_i1:317-490(+)